MKKDLIQKVSVKRYCGRKYPEFWLTDRGLITAILNDADAKLVWINTTKVYPNDKEKALLVELSNVLGKKFLTAVYSLMQITEVGVIDVLGLTVTASQGLRNEDASTLYRKMMTVLKKYPKYHRMARKGFKRSRKRLKQLEDLL